MGCPSFHNFNTKFRLKKFIQKIDIHKGAFLLVIILRKCVHRSSWNGKWKATQFFSGRFFLQNNMLSQCECKSVMKNDCVVVYPLNNDNTLQRYTSKLINLWIDLVVLPHIKQSTHMAYATYTHKNYIFRQKANALFTTTKISCLLSYSSELKRADCEQQTISTTQNITIKLMSDVRKEVVTYNRPTIIKYTRCV